MNFVVPDWIVLIATWRAGSRRKGYRGMARNERVLAKLARDAVNEATLSDSAVQHPTAAVGPTFLACRFLLAAKVVRAYCS
jgi:hypothetical protein